MNYLCVTCGTQFPESDAAPNSCSICEDERQYVGLDGQQWTTLDDLRLDHHNKLHAEELPLVSIHTEPRFAIGERAFLLETEEGNILWDCIALLDETTREHIESLGGLQAIAISHPHYYTTMIEWSRTFGNAPIYIHEADRPWVMRPDPAIEFWNQEMCGLFGGLTLIRCGGHFAGGTVLHWAAGAAGKGVLLSGDVIQVTPDLRSVSFMYSYPNYIPLNAASVSRIVAAVDPFPFDRIYGAFPKMTIAANAKEVLHRSAARYLAAIK